MKAFQVSAFAVECVCWDGIQAKVWILFLAPIRPAKVEPGFFVTCFIMYIVIRGSRGVLGLDPRFFMAIFNPMNKRGRPPKAPEDCKSTSIRIPLTEAEKESLELAAKSRKAKPITWARETLLRAAKR